MSEKKDIDDHSGIETTGHEWDGIKELNNPAPRWLLWVFFVTIIWSVGYWVIYPAWPTLSGNTQGTMGWTSHKKLAAEQEEILMRRGEFAEKLRTHSLEQIQNDPKLHASAVAGGKVMFKENCAACHGTGAQGGPGYPNLNDDEWIWGGALEDIYHTIRVGIRSTHSDSRLSQMPAFGKDGTLKPEQIASVADYVISLSSGKGGTEAGMTLFKANCAACHGDGGHGNRELGAPNLADAIWLYGSRKGDITAQITNPRHGVMPTWETRLPDETIKQLTIYVHSLGGGENAKPAE